MGKALWLNAPQVAPTQEQDTELPKAVEVARKLANPSGAARIVTEWAERRVATRCLLTAISCPVFAATDPYQTTWLVKQQSQTDTVSLVVTQRAHCLFRLSFDRQVPTGRIGLSP